MRLRCCVAFCKNTADHVSTSDGKSLSNDRGVSFHWFPRDEPQRAAWLRALGKQDAPLPESAMVCSQHFLLDDFEAGSGKQLRADAVPSMVQVCVTCLATNTKMFLMSKYKLNEVYETLTGFPLFTEGNLKQTVCALCAQSLINFNRFKNKSSRACSLLENLVTKHGIITIKHIFMINRTRHQLKDNFVTTTYGPDHCDLQILYNDTQTEKSKDTVYRVEKSVTVRNKSSNGLELTDREEIFKDHCYARKVCVDNSISDESIMLASMLVDDEACKVLQKTQPSNTVIKVCMTCLATDTKMFLMSKYKLNEVYEALTGNTVFNQGDIKQRVCVHCAKSLIKFNRFRDKSLRAHALIMELVEKHEIITIRHIKMINRTKHQLKDNFVTTTHGPDHCDLHILYNDRQTEKLKNKVTVRNKKSIGPELKDPEEVENSMSDESIMRAMKQVDDELCKALQKTQAASSSAVTKHASRTKERTKINVSSSVTCVLCFEEFSSDREHLEHMTWHLQNTGSDGERDASQVCEAGTSASCSRGSSHNTQNKLVSVKLNDDRQTSASSVRTYASPASARRAKNNKYKVHTAAEINTTQNTGSNGERDASQVCEPVISASCSRGSSHNTQNKLVTYKLNDDLQPSTFDTPESARRAKINKYKVHTAAEKINTTQNTGSDGERDASQICEPGTSASCSRGSSHNTQNKLVSYKINDNLQRSTFVTPSSNRAKIYKHKVHTAAEENNTTQVNIEINNALEDLLPDSLKVSSIDHVLNSSINTVLVKDEFPTDSRNAISVCDSQNINRASKYCKDYLSASQSVVTSSGSVKRDTQTSINLDKPFSCHLCDFRYRYVNKFLIHMRYHTGERPYSCTLCEYKCADKSSLVVHMRTHSTERPYSCQLCDYTCKSKSHLVSHMRVHSGEKPFSCEFCGYKFAQINQLHIHVRSHTGIKPFACQLCDFKTARKCHLKRHMSIHTGEKPFPCKICNLKFTRKCHVRKHMATHTGLKPFSCDICNRSFTHKKNLMSHIITHSDKKPFSCNICNRKFAQKYYIRSHMKIHTGEKPFSCNLCHRKFAHKTSLVSHIRLKSCKKRFYCDSCHRKFINKSSLVSHIRTHESKPRFCCDLCDRKYIHKGTLVTHIKTHESKPRFCCDLCNRNFGKKNCLVNHLKTHSKVL